MTLVNYNKIITKKGFFKIELPFFMVIFVRIMENHRLSIYEK
jgi:hypothetical protein